LATVGSLALCLVSFAAVISAVNCTRRAGATEHHDALVREATLDAALGRTERAERPAQDATARAATPRERALPFVAHAVERCYLDRLARSEYLDDWVRAGGIERGIPAGDPVPSPSLSLPSWGPRPSDASFARERDAMLRALVDGRSHVMDCTFSVRAKAPPHGLGAVTYAVYLPADYLQNPGRSRAVLLLVPGGRGDRTRWFLTAKPGSLFERGTGGLSLRSRVDRYASEHPSASIPIVVTTDGPTGRWIDGRVEYIARDLPSHVARTYLPHIPERQVAFGVQAISIGAAFTMRAAFSDPTRFRSIGLMGMFCDREGLWPERDFAPDPEQFYGVLAGLVARGALAMRMDIGRRDTLYDCNKRWYFALQRAGVFERREEPAYERCEGRGAPSSARCWARWPGFTAIPRLGHHYAAVVPVFDEDLQWQLDRLTAITESALSIRR
jgi:hypothetical protein